MFEKFIVNFEKLEKKKKEKRWQEKEKTGQLSIITDPQTRQRVSCHYYSQNSKALH